MRSGAVTRAVTVVVHIQDRNRDSATEGHCDRDIGTETFGSWDRETQRQCDRVTETLGQRNCDKDTVTDKDRDPVTETSPIGVIQRWLQDERDESW